MSYDPKDRFEIMSDSWLISMRYSYQVDLRGAQKREDDKAVTHCKGRIEMLEDILESRAKQPRRAV